MLLLFWSNHYFCIKTVEEKAFLSEQILKHHTGFVVVLEVSVYDQK